MRPLLNMHPLLDLKPCIFGIWVMAGHEGKNLLKNPLKKLLKNI